MTRYEFVIANLGICFVLLGSLTAMVFRTESFPFSSYPMYSRVSRMPFELGRVVGVIEEGDELYEVALDSAAYLFPFSDRTLRTALRTVAERGPEAASAALRDQLAVYNGRLAEHGGPHLDGMRFYAMVLTRNAEGNLAVSKGKLLAATEQP